jgi:23S rRNA (guanine745-N1)-methyltransferase
MNVSALIPFVCPVDRLPLVKGVNTLRCVNGHNFDVAREGYCNLLLVQQKRTLDPGDNQKMVAARQRFLDAGHFTKIADQLFEIVSKIATKFKADNPLRIVDAGCGVKRAFNTHP